MILLSTIWQFFNNRLTFRGKLWVIGIALFLILAIVAGVFVWNWYQGRNEAVRRAEEALSQAGQITVENSKVNANVAENVANQSVNEANKARNANINSFGNNFDNSRKRYCERFPKDCL